MSLLAKFGFEFIFAMGLTTLLASLGLMQRIKHGDMQITHITLRPYKIACIFCLLLLFCSG